MNEFQKRVIKVWLNILGGIAFMVFVFASCCHDWWLGQAIICAVLGGYMAFAIIILLMEAVMRWRIRGACQCEADLDVAFWFRTAIQENRFDEYIEKVEKERIPSVSALGKQGTIDTLKRFSQVKRPKFLWWKY